MNTPICVDGLEQAIRRWWSGSVASPGSATSESQDNLRESADLRSVELLMVRLPRYSVANRIVELLYGSDPMPSPPIPVDDPSTPSDWLALKRHALLATWVRSVSDVSRLGAEQPSAKMATVDTANADDIPACLDAIETCYGQLPADSPERIQLLTWLAWEDELGLRRWTQLLVDDPPIADAGIKDFFAPLLRRAEVPVDALFPNLLLAISQAELATAVLDLANFLYREREVRPHPATPRVQSLAQLLANVTQQLMQIESSPLESGIAPDQISRVINDSVGLLSALCDCVALVGDRSIVGKLYPCLEVRHRRVQLEASYALATLGEEAGRQRLVELAAEPLVRRRVLAYSEPLGLTEKIAAEFRTPAAAAESELVLSLSHPQNLGLAPKSTELLDHRRQFWPGYEAMVDSYLFLFEYPFTENPYRNVGIVGPLTHSFSASLCELSVDDMYAVFAGWHVSHPEIYAVEQADFSPHQLGTLAGLERRLTDQDVTDLQPLLLGHFFGQWVLVARGIKNSQTGWAVTDADAPLWLPDSGGFTQLDAALVWYFWMGRTMLRQFNPPSTNHPS